MLFDSIDRCPDTHLRNNLESWFEKFPPESQKDIGGRFRSDIVEQHEGALFELFLHELFTQLGCTLKVHPAIAGVSSRPDFLVCHGDLRFYLEATVAGEGSGPFTRSRNEKDVICKLNKLTSAHFRIGVHMKGTLRRTLSKENVVRPFKELLNSWDPNEVRRLIDEGGRRAALSRKIECGNWSLEGRLSPIDPENRGSDQTQQIVINPFQGQFTDSVTPVREALSGKAKEYGKPDAPLVVAVNARDMFYNGKDSDLTVLFGDEQLLYFSDQPDSPPQYGRKPNGVWSSASRLDAFLRFQSVDFWNLSRASACLYTNPRNTDMELPDALFRLPHGKVRNDGEMEWVEGENIAQLVRLN